MHLNFKQSQYQVSDVDVVTRSKQDQLSNYQAYAVEASAASKGLLGHA